MAPRVLVSDELSETAVQIFRDRGVDVDFQPQLGKDKEKLAEIIGNYDGLAIRSATKATEKLIAAATNLKVIGRAGIGVSATMATIMIIPVVVIMMSMVVMFMIGIGHIRPSGVWLQCHS